MRHLKTLGQAASPSIGSGKRPSLPLLNVVADACSYYVPELVFVREVSHVIGFRRLRRRGVGSSC